MTVRGETRLELFKRLVKLAVSSEARVASDVLACVRAAKVDGETVTLFLNEVRNTLAPPAAKGAKRGRTSMAGAASTAARTERLPELVVVLESVEFASVPASHGLLLSLFDLLAVLVELPTSAGQTDVSYPGQLILGALARVVESVQPMSGVTSDSIRMAPVLDFMRSSINPQIYSQSLLLLSQLGPLVPDQLVHNVMPIFTFMGANVLQRDDAYSLRVVDQTLDNIVPALVKAMQRTADGRDGLLAELRDLLRAFTDAAAHVPRHRRINLFTRLVETLGAKQFLSAVAMLLVDKAGKSSDAGALPLALAEHFDVATQLSAYQQVVDELQRVVALEPSFLQPADEQVAPTKAKEQALALLNFLAFALETKQLLSKVDAARTATVAGAVDISLMEVVRGLLDLTTATADSFSDEDRADLAEGADYVVHATVALMSTRSFADALLWLLELADPSIQPRAFALLRARLPHVKPTRRADLSVAVVAVVETVQEVLASAEETDADAVSGALETLDAVAESVFPEEDAALAKTIPALVDIARDEQRVEKTRAAAFAVLAKLSCVAPSLQPSQSRSLTPRARQEPPRPTPHPARRQARPVRARRARVAGSCRRFRGYGAHLGRLLDARGPVQLGPDLYRRSARQGLLGGVVARAHVALARQGRVGSQGTCGAPVGRGQEAPRQDAVPCHHPPPRVARRQAARAAPRLARPPQPRPAVRQDGRRRRQLPRHLQAVPHRV